MARHGDDCYFFFYSTCNKGSKCPYRHCEAALGTEIVCKNWQKFGLCRKMDCPYRHMQIDKFRSSIPCYWETQPGGCRKPHCVFKHKIARNEFGTMRDASVGTLVDGKTIEKETTPSPSKPQSGSLEAEKSPVVVVKPKNSVSSETRTAVGSQKRSIILPSVEMLQPGLQKIRQVASNRVVLPASTVEQVHPNTEAKASLVNENKTSTVEKRPLRGDLREKLMKRRKQPVIALEELQSVPLFEDKDFDSSDSDFVTVFRSSKKRSMPPDSGGKTGPVKLKRRWITSSTVPTDQKDDTRKSVEPVEQVSSIGCGCAPELSDVSENQGKNLGDLLPSSPPVVPIEDADSKNDGRLQSAVSTEYEARMVEVFGQDLAQQFLAQGIRFEMDELELERKRRVSEET